MKKLFALLAFAAWVALAGAALGQEKPVAAPDKPAAEAAKPAADAKSAAAPESRKEQTKPAPTPNKGDVSWMLVSTAFVLMNSPQHTDRLNSSEAMMPDDREMNHQTCEFTRTPWCSRRW